MCVDDYQFRHYSATRGKICRKFIVVDEHEFAKNFLVNVSQFEQNGEVGLCKILIYLASKGLVIENRKFYLPQFSAIIEPFTYCKIAFQSLVEREVYVRSYPGWKESQEIFEEDGGRPEEGGTERNYYCRFEEIEEVEDVYEMMVKEMAQVGKGDRTREDALGEEMDKMVDEYWEKGNQKTEEGNENMQENEKTLERNEKMEHGNEKMEQGNENMQEVGRKWKEERKIGQVIRAVKLWRKLYESKRCNLTNAAKVVGISKKSLDDYYLVLRIGEVLGFGYEGHLEEGMGELRNFIREQEEKVRGKLGKRVECFALVEEVDLDRLLLDFRLKEGA